MQPPAPGFDPRRLLDLMQAAIGRCALDLSGYVVFTEAASGAYVVTPVLAAMAGADQVYALTRSTRHGTREEIAAQTGQLARLAGVAQRVDVLFEKSRQAIEQADIVTNSGHVRPIDAETVSWMKSTAVVPLMYERWELRESDVDLAACRARGIRLVGTNERHPAVDVFSFLGIMAVKLLLDARVAVYSSRVLLLCDNPFRPFIERGLTASGAAVDCADAPAGVPQGMQYDAIVVARTPTAQPALSEADVATIARRWPGAVVAVFWGDVDRAVLDRAGLGHWPPEAPEAGHMGILPAEVGPEPIVRLQAGSLKAAQAMLRHAGCPDHPAFAFAQPL